MRTPVTPTHQYNSVVVVERYPLAGRVPQHTFLDYSITNYILAIIFAFAFGEAGHLRPNFIEQVKNLTSAEQPWQARMLLPKLLSV